MEDRVVCSCLDVTYNTIKEAIENGAKTLDDIKDETEAGTICGMCEDEIQEIIDGVIEEAENKKTETDKTETNQEEQSNVAEQTKDEEHQENKEKVKSEN